MKRFTVVLFIGLLYAGFVANSQAAPPLGPFALRNMHYDANKNVVVRILPRLPFTSPSYEIITEETAKDLYPNVWWTFWGSRKAETTQESSVQENIAQETIKQESVPLTPPNEVTNKTQEVTQSIVATKVTEKTEAKATTEAKVTTETKAATNVKATTETNTSEAGPTQELPIVAEQNEGEWKLPELPEFTVEGYEIAPLMGKVNESIIEATQDDTNDNNNYFNRGSINDYLPAVPYEYEKF